ncbi:TIR domain-containing protein [uncultured Porphyromonas sp.]|uniref:TIR domain-containing protein n=1 Tax=uncultured Porphyromonas sp. TaxID=159274 RepID=UPI00261BF3C0|nr:TIR domain-containing protein [uncultured Porphyromonas sp.]
MQIKINIKLFPFVPFVAIGGVVCMGCSSESNQRVPISVQEEFRRVVSNSKQALPSGEKPMIYISGTDNDKGAIASIIAFLEEECNAECVTSDDCEPGEDVRASIKRNLKEAQICFVVLTSDYCNAIEEVESTVSREYRQIYDELSTPPENARIIPIFFGDKPRNVPRCLKNRQGIFLSKPHTNWLVDKLIGSLTIKTWWGSINLQSAKI